MLITVNKNWDKFEKKIENYSINATEIAWKIFQNKNKKELEKKENSKYYQMYKELRESKLKKILNDLPF